MLEEESMLPFVFRLGGSGAAASHSRGTRIRSFGQTRMTPLKQKPCRGGLAPSQHLFLAPGNVAEPFLPAVPITCSTLPPASQLYQHNCLWDHNNAVPPAPSPPKKAGELFLAGSVVWSSVHHVAYRLTGTLCTFSKDRRAAQGLCERLKRMSKEMLVNLWFEF